MEEDPENDDSSKKRMQFAVYNLALMHYKFGHFEESKKV